MRTDHLRENLRRQHGVEIERSSKGHARVTLDGKSVIAPLYGPIRELSGRVVEKIKQQLGIDDEEK